MDPLSFIKGEISEIEARVKLAVQIAMYREEAEVALSRLATLDPPNYQKYVDAIKAMG